MNKEEFHLFHAHQVPDSSLLHLQTPRTDGTVSLYPLDVRPPRTISAHHLQNQAPRTLLYGRNTDRTVQHVYLKEGVLHLLVLEGSFLRIVAHKQGSIPFEELVPSSKLHPERCDFEICQLLRARGVKLSFSRFNEEEESLNGRKYAGLVLRQKPILVAE